MGSLPGWWWNNVGWITLGYLEGEMMGKHTAGPWIWCGNTGSKSLYLATAHSGRRYVMDFVRWGMQGAQPRFQPPAKDGGYSTMVDGKDLVKFVVGDHSITGVNNADGSVYRYDVMDIDCPDAHLIAAAPELLEALDKIMGDERCCCPMSIGDPRYTSHEQHCLNAAAAIAKAKGES